MQTLYRLIVCICIMQAFSYAQTCDSGEPDEDLCVMKRCDSPVVIALGNSAYEFTSSQYGVIFDINADGLKESVAWTIAEKRIGFLVLDRNGNGTIDSGEELFGTRAYQPASPKPNGFAALAVFDNLQFGGNDNGMIDSGDAAFGVLRLWIDANHDGQSQPEEMISLSDAGIESISLNVESSNRKDGNGNLFRYRARVNSIKGFTVSPRAYDVFLVVGPTP
jgi:hypothetical protein